MARREVGWAMPYADRSPPTEKSPRLSDHTPGRPGESAQPPVVHELRQTRATTGELTRPSCSILYTPADALVRILRLNSD